MPELKPARYHVRTQCPNELCSFVALIGGCRTPEEAIAAGEAVGRNHHQFEHPGTEDDVTFNVYDGTDPEVTLNNTSGNGQSTLKN